MFVRQGGCLRGKGSREIRQRARLNKENSNLGKQMQC